MIDGALGSFDDQRGLPERVELLAHSAVLPPEPSLGEGRRRSQARRVGERIFSETQRPEDLKSRSYPGPRPRFLIGIASRQPATQASICQEKESAF